MTDGLLSLRERPRLAAAGALAAVAIGSIAGTSPHLTISLALVLIVLIVTLRNLLGGLVLFTILTFPNNLPSGLSFGATVAKPLGLAVIVSWIASLVKDRSTPFLFTDAPGVAWTAAALVGWATLSAAWAPDPMTTLSSASRLFQVVLLMFVAYSAVRRARDLVILAGGFVVAASATSAYALASGQTLAGRLTGGIQNPNALAAGVLAATAIGAFMLASGLRPVLRSVIVALLAVNVAAFLGAASRGATVAAGVALLASVVFAGPLRPRAVVAASLCAAVGVGYYSLAGPSSVAGRLTEISFQASNGRTALWQLALRVAADHPLGGVGLGNFPVVEFDYFQNTPGLLDSGEIARTGGQLVVHNTYLEYLAELGSIGLFMWAALIVLIIVPAVRAVTSRQRPDSWASRTVGRGLVVAGIAMLVNLLFDSYEYSKQVWLLLGLLTAFGYGLERSQAVRQERHRTPTAP